MFDSAGPNSGTLSNITLGVPGLAGTAYGFNGVDSIVTVPDSPTLNPGSSDFSFTLSVRFTLIPKSDYDLLRKGLSTTQGGDYKLEALSGSTVRWHKPIACSQAQTGRATSSRDPISPTGTGIRSAVPRQRGRSA